MTINIYRYELRSNDLGVYVYDREMGDVIRGEARAVIYFGSGDAAMDWLQENRPWPYPC